MAKSDPKASGTDPLVWVERLLDVNEASSFTSVQKDAVRNHLMNLQDALQRQKEPPNDC